ncbi:MAG TPA: ABC transporter ATP-binding protein [Candidatus Eisenbacteria bacterium]|nr:ABC transporter ATP-binding protein [Candidatus Eisenbacteria bacterium]
MLTGLVFMVLYSLLSGFSLALTAPIIQKIFLRTEPASGDVLHVGEGLARTWSAIGQALGSPGSMTERISAAGHAAVIGLGAIQDHAPPLEVLGWLCLVTLVAIFLKNASDVARKISFLRVEQATTEALRRDLFARVLEFPLATVHRTGSGQLLARIVSDVELVKQLTINNAAVFIHNLLLILVFLGICLWQSVELSAATLLIVPPVALLTAKLSSRLRKQSGRAQARIAELTAALNETLSGIRIVKGFGAEPEERERFGRATAQYRRAVVKLLSLDALAGPLSEFWGVAIGVAVLYYGGQLLLQPDPTMSVGQFFLFFFALVSMLHPLKELANTVARFQRGAAAAARIFEILDMPGESEEPDALPVTGLRRDIVFEDVSFAYEGRPEVLAEVSFRARAGTTTALVGPSGAGKSTLVDLIPRFIDPALGRVLLDGQDLRRLRRRELRALIGIVSQEPILFNDSILRNIGYANPRASQDAIMQAAETANAHDFITALPHGYETHIGERGVFLSGGQRQRIAIARAVLRNPAILILDEATSSLDAESEMLVQEALERLQSGRTTFVIAHRLSTVLGADQILVMDRGRIVDRGRHEELLVRAGLYRRLYQLQFKNEDIPRVDVVES